MIFAFSIGYLVTAVNLGSPISNNRLEPSFFPLVLGSFAVLFSSILLFREISANKTQASKSEQASIDLEKTEAEMSKYAPLWIMLSIFSYIFAFSLVGYFISSFLFVLSIITIFSKWEKMLYKSTISIIIVLIGYLIFEQIFGVRLPALWG
ncbi:tripartite tricarboxylate transporter TctB family protein [Marinomonas sp. 15G1-11]|uniref:Tripartite tricarboxylate transporter TctB family protein n=1 Tax=Marinomonas phaeophyticola TaxID=3004091 RepID=A0ABT4JQ52_9GAMM|nr:tripartite tricarboxylate transporter TctB family protein [Marinomonas sp. 15G1-11]MCZ2720137.1 tripartite tricarboxylate transporter TctB family protein [Marinomonas sp. 15G1-11]